MLSPQYQSPKISPSNPSVYTQAMTKTAIVINTALPIAIHKVVSHVNSPFCLLRALSCRMNASRPVIVSARGLLVSIQSCNVSIENELYRLGHKPNNASKVAIPNQTMQIEITRNSSEYFSVEIVDLAFMIKPVAASNSDWESPQTPSNCVSFESKNSCLVISS